MEEGRVEMTAGQLLFRTSGRNGIFFFFFLRLRDRNTRIEPFETTTIAVVGRTKVDCRKS